MTNDLKSKRFWQSPLLLFFVALLFDVFEILQFNTFSTAGIEGYEFGGTTCLVVSVMIWCMSLFLSAFGVYFATRNLVAGERVVRALVGVVLNLLLIGMHVILIFDAISMLNSGFFEKT